MKYNLDNKHTKMFNLLIKRKMKIKNNEIKYHFYQTVTLKVPFLRVPAIKWGFRFITYINFKVLVPSFLTNKVTKTSI